MLLNTDWLMGQGVDAPLLHAVSAAFLRPPQSVAVAVSGGGDSMALLDLAGRVSEQTGVRLLAVTVDHGLRAEAPREAQMVAEFCADRGIPHQTLHWTGQAEGNLMAAAREARYRLISDWAREQDCNHVLIGHTSDDEAETVLMGLSRGAGVDGLSGISHKARHHGIEWARPLLGTSRAELREYLVRRGISWVDDPTNEDDQYLRVRVRQTLPDLDRIGINAEQIATSAHALKMARNALEFYVEAEADKHVTQQAGDIILPRGFQTLMPLDIQRRLWVSTLRWIGGGSYAPRESAISELNHAIQQGKNHTLNGCVILVKEDRIYITREWNAVRDDSTETTEIWDRRWQLSGPHDAALRVAPVGEEGIRQIEDWRMSGLPRPAIISSPAIWNEKTLIAAPIAGFNPDWSAQIVAPWHPVAKHALNL